MTETCQLPQFTLRRASQIIAQLYSVEVSEEHGGITPLAGERDLNFLIKSGNQRFVFKITNRDESADMLECQSQVFERINANSKDNIAPVIVKSKSGNLIENIKSEKGDTHLCRMVEYISGSLLSSVHPHSSALLENLGKTVGYIDSQLASYQHKAIERPLLWNMANAVDTINEFLPLIADTKRQDLINVFLGRFKNNVSPIANQLRSSVIHNDVNDNNVVISDTTQSGPWDQYIKGVIDYGDMVYGWTVIDPAVASAYMMLDKEFPLEAAGAVVKGYNRVNPLTDIEIQVLFDLICIRLCMSVCICAYQITLEPENDYLRISEKPAWDCLIRLEKLSPKFVYFYFRNQCGLEPVPSASRVTDYLKKLDHSFDSIVPVDLFNSALWIMDTSVASPDLPGPSVQFDPRKATTEVFRRLEDENAVAGIGRYDEYRLIYSSEDFTDSTGYRRTLHLGIDIFMAAGTHIYAPMDGTVFAAANNDSPLDYGGTLILEHSFKDASGEGRFYTLYGHLNPDSLGQHKPGNTIQSGQMIAQMGEIHENGNWVPHVHFEIVTDMLEEIDTFVGVGTHAHRDVWLSLCPDPNVILGIPQLKPEIPSPDELQANILKSRDAYLAPSLSLSYNTPIHMVRGDRQYLYDFTGRQYLDAVNNVPHVGHCHPTVVEAIQRQSRLLNTNTRYLYKEIQTYTERLLDKFPEPLRVCFLVNSGSEANDLALRLATNYTGRKQKIILDHAYHGNLSSLIEISPYKHNSPGGNGPPANVHTALMPDGFRGSFKSSDPDWVNSYLQSVVQCIENTQSNEMNNNGPALFIAESILSCGGQIVLPEGYLKAVYKLVRDAGGICIADEVQVGFGRTGSHFWAFESQDVVPDIVTLGKPIGNGHPLAAVVTTSEIAQAFNNGMEYFNTYGGNAISCAVGNAVLDVIEQEGLQENALRVGNLFLAELENLKSEFPIIGDVRGLGLFIGVELVDCSGSNKSLLQPARHQAKYIVERLCQEGILSSTDGPCNNVIKIKPPICFNEGNVGFYIQALSRILTEDYSKPS